MLTLLSLTRRLFITTLSAVGVASTTAIAQTEDTDTGYGAGDYGIVPYGGGADGTDGPTIGDPISSEPDPELTITEFTAVETNPKNPHANIRVEWGVDDTGGELAALMIRLEDVRGDLISRYGESPSRDSSSGTWEHRVRHGGGRTYHISILVETSDGRSETDTLELTSS